MPAALWDVLARRFGPLRRCANLEPVTRFDGHSSLQQFVYPA